MCQCAKIEWKLKLLYLTTNAIINHISFVQSHSDLLLLTHLTLQIYYFEKNGTFYCLLYSISNAECGLSTLDNTYFNFTSCLNRCILHLLSSLKNLISAVVVDNIHWIFSQITSLKSLRLRKLLD